MHPSNRLPSALAIWWQITRKDLLLLWRDRSALFFALGFPLIMAVFFGTAFSGNSKGLQITVAVVNEDATPAARAWLDKLGENAALKLKPMEREAALQGVRKGRWRAALILPKGFGQAQEQIFDPDIPQVELAIDPTRKGLAGWLQGLLMARGAEDMQQAFGNQEQMQKQVRRSLETIRQLPAAEQPDPAVIQLLEDLEKNLDKLAADQANNTKADTADENAFTFQPLKVKLIDLPTVRKGPGNAYAVSFPQGMVWAILGVISTFALGLVTELNQGTLARLLVMPVRRRDVLGGKALACMLTLMLVLLLLLLIGMLAFGIRVHDPLVLLLALFSAAFGFTGLMMLLSVLGKSERSASGLSWAVMVILAMTGGGMIPLMAMPPWMAALGQFSPVKWMVMAFEGALWRQFSLAEVLPWAGLLLALGIVGLSLGSWIFSRRQVQAG